MSRNPYPSLTLLARSFPTFAPGGPRHDAPGVEPFDSTALHAASRSWDRIEAVTADFLLERLQRERVDVRHVSTIGAWDDEHRAAFAAWMKNLYLG